MLLQKPFITSYVLRQSLITYAALDNGHVRHCLVTLVSLAAPLDSAYVIGTCKSKAWGSAPTVSARCCRGRRPRAAPRPSSTRRCRRSSHKCRRLLGSPGWGSENSDKYWFLKTVLELVVFPRPKSTSLNVNVFLLAARFYWILLETARRKMQVLYNVGLEGLKIVMSSRTQKTNLRLAVT